MRPVIIESPYRGGDYSRTKRNVAYLSACVRDCLDRGETPYSSVAMIAMMSGLDDKVPEDRELGMSAGWAWYGIVKSAGGAVVIYVDRGISEGMQLGMERARGIGIEIEQRRLGEEWSR